MNNNKNYCETSHGVFSLEQHSNEHQQQQINSSSTSETTQFFQQISVAIQINNVVSFMSI